MSEVDGEDLVPSPIICQSVLRSHNIYCAQDRLPFFHVQKYPICIWSFKNLIFQAACILLTFIIPRQYTLQCVKLHHASYISQHPLRKPVRAIFAWHCHEANSAKYKQCVHHIAAVDNTALQLPHGLYFFKWLLDWSCFVCGRTAHYVCRGFSFSSI